MITRLCSIRNLLTWSGRGNEILTVRFFKAVFLVQSEEANWMSLRWTTQSRVEQVARRRHLQDITTKLASLIRMSSSG